jgi:pimeloyl-ACP methyl ester carboxylesterase
VLYDEVPHPTASVVLFVGGDGELAHNEGSFLLRIRDRFVAAGMSVAVPDTPSDHPGGFGPLFRTWAAHTQDEAAIVAFLKSKSPAPIWAVGNSNGTISAANGAARLGPDAFAGIVLTSSVWLSGLALLPIETISVPVLDVQNHNDACPASKLYLSEKNMVRFKAAPAKQLVVVYGGGDGPRCGTGSPHDFYGLDDAVTPVIIDWIEGKCAGPASGEGAAGAPKLAARCSSGIVESLRGRKRARP